MAFVYLGKRKIFMENESLPVHFSLPFETLVAWVLQLPANYQERLVSIIQQTTPRYTIDYQGFEEWNSEFENQNLDEYLPEYGMTLLEFRKQQWADEMETETQMNEVQFNQWLNQTWKSHFCSNRIR